jgi:hypothetical protein
MQHVAVQRTFPLHGGGEVVGRVIGIQDFTRGYDYIIVRAPLWLSHSGAKGVGRKGCLKRVVPSHSVGLGGQPRTRLRIILSQMLDSSDC